MILDVGCGLRPLGDINVDIYKNYNPQVSRPNLFCFKKIPNFILADGAYLPFRNEIFETVVSDNSLEHSSEYFLFLKELLRVSKNSVIIRVPHVLSYMNRKTKSHKQYFTIKWFDETLTKLGFHRHNFDIYISAWNYFPHQFLPLVRTPRQIMIKISKRRHPLI